MSFLVVFLVYCTSPFCLSAAPCAKALLHYELIHVQRYRRWQRRSARWVHRMLRCWGRLDPLGAKPLTLLAILSCFFDKATFKKENTSFHGVSTFSFKCPPNFPSNMDAWTNMWGFAGVACFPGGLETSQPALVHYAHFQTSRQSDSFTQQPQRCRISKIPISKSASARSRVRIACEGKFALSEIYHKFAWQPAGFCA